MSSKLRDCTDRQLSIARDYLSGLTLKEVGARHGIGLRMAGHDLHKVARKAGISASVNATKLRDLGHLYRSLNTEEARRLALKPAPPAVEDRCA
jgi:DNA-binding CsgD family transcriptional regulator